MEEQMDEKFVKKEMFVGGVWRDGSSEVVFQVKDPASGDILGYVPDCQEVDVEDAIKIADKAFKTYRKTTVKERCELLSRIRDLLKRYQKNLAEIIVSESGKPLPQAVREVELSAAYMDWFVGEARRAYGDTIPCFNGGKQMMTIKQPVGVIAVITPWNFPILIIARKTSALLGAGCTCVIKPAEDTPLTALAFAKICELARVPAGVVNVVTCSREKVMRVGEVFANNPLISLLSFTGSTATGKWLYERCSSTVKRLHLELGGNAPFIVFDSADLNIAVEEAMLCKFMNAGQRCVSANRIFVQSGVHDLFVDMMNNAMDKLCVGPGMDPGITVGPLINERQFHKVDALVRDARSKGAQFVRGGSHESLGLPFYQPTLLTKVTREMLAFREEIFGPVAAIIKFDTEEECVEMANDCNRGLAGYVYTTDLMQAWRVVNEMEVGIVGVNEFMPACPEVPFGGIKESGIGKEGGHQGLDEFLHTKCICFGNLG